MSSVIDLVHQVNRSLIVKVKCLVRDERLYGSSSLR